MIYYLILSVLFFFSIVDFFSGKYEKEFHYCFYAFFLLLLVVSGLRYGIGMDYFAYNGLYQDSFELNDEIKETGFRYLFYFFKNISVPFACMIFLFSYITMKYAFCFIRKYSPFVFLSVLIFYSVGQFYFNTFNVIRQTLVAYVFLGVLVGWLEERNFKKYLLGVIFMSFCFHMSAIILLPLYFFVYKRINNYIRLLIIILLYFSSSLLIFLIYNSPYSMYLTFEHNSAEVALTMYLVFIIAVIIAVFESFYSVKTVREKILFNLNYISIVIIMLVILFENTPLVLFFSRISYFFTPVQIVLIPIIINHFFQHKSKLIIISLLSILYTGLCIMSIHSNGVSNRLLPYQTIFSTY
ncbi:EpsG family protein [Bacteroides sp.]|uniref:EpsG family protein n=1 Tax=Bacteroides sp. TaxID=29523 RepID=UPI0026143E07|nr:EpsG family protein [Bacteroides sp.]